MTHTSSFCLPSMSLVCTFPRLLPFAFGCGCFSLFSGLLCFGLLREFALSKKLLKGERNLLTQPNENGKKNRDNEGGTGGEHTNIEWTHIICVMASKLITWESLVATN